MNRRQLVGMLKDWGLALGIVIAALFVWSLFQPHPPSSGAAPALALVDLEGNAVHMADLTEDVVVLNFWATWCGPCRAEIPELVAYHEAHPEVGLYGISVDEGISPARLEAFARKTHMTYPVLHDASGQAYADYGLSGVPVTFILDRERSIRHTLVGSLSRERLERAVRGAKAAKPEI
jgi:peroxiredoxin